MVEKKWSLQRDFAPLKREDWRQRVEADLPARSLKRLVSSPEAGVQIEALYTGEDRLGSDDAAQVPGFGTLRRGASPLGQTQGLDIRPRVEASTPEAANEALLEELTRGATSIWLRLDSGARQGVPSDGGVDSAEGLRRALDKMRLAEAGLSIEAGASAGAVARHMRAIIDGQAPPKDVSLGLDPLGQLAGHGILERGLPASLDEMVEAAGWASARPGVRAVRVDTSVYHHAGADEAQSLAMGVATGLAYLRAMGGSGLSLEEALGQIDFRLRVGTHFFLSIAKLRAARVLWSRVAQVCGAADAEMVVAATPSERAWTRRDPWVNMLRNTAGVFASAVGGADTITSLPFDAAIGEADALSRRVARNTPIILEQESGLHRVIDPAGGCWFLENLTDQLAQKAWRIFQQVEARGGAAEAIVSGWIQAQVRTCADARAAEVARRKRPITGVSEFPSLREVPVERPSSRPRRGLAQGSVGEMATVAEPLEPRRDAEPFERLRDLGDTWPSGRPRVFSAKLGSVAQHTGRASFARNLLEVGGFEVVGQSCSTAEAAAEAFSASGAAFAVVCSSDEVYASMALITVEALRRAGAQRIILAGRSAALAESLEEAGLSDEIYLGCDALALLTSLWVETQGGDDV